jgi:hypothetical protein
MKNGKNKQMMKVIYKLWSTVCLTDYKLLLTNKEVGLDINQDNF